MTIEFSSFSEPGPRPENEDFLLIKIISESFIFACIADGVGGQRAGKFASQFAGNGLLKGIEFNREADLRSLFEQLHSDLISYAKQEPEKYGAATTLSAACISGNVLRFAHIGDTRVTLYRGNGVQQLTEDHTEVYRFLKAGKITWDEAENYSRKNVLESALGGSADLKIQTGEIELRNDDRLILSSDGIHGKLLKREILRLSLEHKSTPEFVSAIKEEIVQRDPTDNYSLLALQIKL